MSRWVNYLKFGRLKEKYLFNGYVCKRCGKMIEVKRKYQYLILLLHLLCVCLALFIVVLFWGTSMRYWGLACICILWIGGHLGIYYMSYCIFKRTISIHRKIECQNRKMQRIALKVYMLMFSNMKGGSVIFITLPFFYLSRRAGKPGEI